MEIPHFIFKAGPQLTGGRGSRGHDAPSAHGSSLGFLSKIAKRRRSYCENSRNRAWMTLNSHLVKAVQVQLKLKLSSTWTHLAFDLSSNSSIMNDSVVICTKYFVSVYPPVIHPICFEASPPLGVSGWHWRGGMSRAADFAFQKLSWHRLFHRNPSYLFAEIGVILVGGIDDAAA